MSVRYVCTCDGCGQSRGHDSLSDWGRVDVREPGVSVAIVRQYDFCSRDCLETWWHQVSCAVDLGAPAGTAAPEGDDRG